MSIQDIVKSFINIPFTFQLIIAGTVFLSKKGRIPLIILTILFYFFSTSFTAQWISDQWSKPDTYSPEKDYDIVVVLLGISDYKWHRSRLSKEFPTYQKFSKNIDRLLEGLLVVREKRERKLLIGDLTIQGISETGLVKKFVKKQGIHDDQVVVYGKIIRTLDEAKGVAAYAKENNVENILLVTSASHMRRAAALFENQGLNPDLKSSNQEYNKITYKSFIPRIFGIKRNEQLMYELIGYLGYWLLGDI